MKWERGEVSDSRVIREEGWKPIKDYTRLDETGGVYIFADDSEDVKYIGKAPQGRMIVEIRNSINSAKNRSATQVRVLHTDSDSNAISLARDLRKKYNPVNI